MYNPAIQRFIDELKLARQIYFVSDQQITCGRLTLTVLPNVYAQSIHSYRFEFPSDFTPSEAPYWYLFLVSVFGAESFCDFEPRLRKSMQLIGTYSEVINGLFLKTFPEGDTGVTLIEAMTS